MPVTYNLIASTTLTSNSTAITFSAIPATYTDLVLRCSLRLNSASFRTLQVRYNGSTSTLYSYTELEGNGATASSSRTSNNNADETTNSATNSNDTSNTFSNIELYIPNYAGNTNKVVSIDSAHETNATTAYRKVHATLWRDTTAISSIVLQSDTAALSGSSFFLYGIKNS